MNLRKNIIYNSTILVLAAAYLLNASSCASTKAAPTGGPKDTIPPVVTAFLPAENTTSFPIEKGEITLTFDEYVQIKDANKNIILSPPQKKAVKTRIKGKNVVVSFQEPLDTNQTYSLNFGAGIVDNNEGNPLYGLSYSFSTGKYIDSLMLSGTVVDAFSLFPIENATIALYLVAKDSTVITDRPDAIARSDKWGYFTVRNLKPLPYHVFAYTDGNTNNRYDQGGEQIAFLDTTITPTKVMKKDSPELQYYDPKDTLACLQRPSEMTLNLFTEKSPIQFIKEYKRFSRRGMGIRFNAENATIDSIGIKGIGKERLVTQNNITNDSLTVWIKGGNKIADTLLFSLKYLKTDSLGKLSPTVENLRMVAPYEKKENRRRDKSSKDDEKRKDLLEFDIYANNKSVEQEGIVLEFKEPLIDINLDTISFRMRNPKMVESDVKFTVEQDMPQITRYIIKPEMQFEKGNDYEIYFPTAAFRDINGFTNDSSVTKISLPTDDNLSSITFEMKNVDARYIVELVNPSRSQVFRKYIIDNDCDLLFPYLSAGDYSLRITEDKNKNGIIDTGDLLKRKQPEKVMLYSLDSGNDIINIAERTDLVQSIDLRKMFGK